jgi:hypothetical protein
MYVYILRDKVTGAKSYEISRFGLVDEENRDIMFLVSVSDAIEANRLVDLLNLDMLVFGNIGDGFVDKSIYYDVLDSRNRALIELKDLRARIEEQAQAIRNSGVEIENLKAMVDDGRSAVDEWMKVLRSTMNALAVLVVIKHPYRAKKAALRAIIHHLYDVLRYGVSEVTDDIPF